MQRSGISGWLVAVAVLALATTGTATAARLVTGKDIRNSSVTGKDIRDRSLTPADFRGSLQGPRGDQGPAGPPGAAGPAGPQGAPGLAGLEVVTGPTVVVQPDSVEGADARCPAGKQVVGTGFFASIGNIGFAENFGTFVGIAVLNDTSIPIEINAEATCASTSGGTQARSATRRYDAKLAALRSAL